MSNTVFILNPAPGGSSYTSAKKAHQFIERGRAIFEDGMLRFINRVHIPARAEASPDNPTWWNGSPVPKILQRPFPRHISDDLTKQVDCRMRKPGEVRS